MFYYASISLKVDRATQQIQRPIEVKNTNDNHIENCLAKEDAFFETKEFLKIQWKNKYGEEDDEEIVTNEILSVANAIEEEVVQDEEVVVAVVVDDGKVACDICGKRYKVNGLNTHKAVHKKNNI